MYVWLVGAFKLKLRTFIIAVDGIPRNPKLVRTLRNSKFISDVEIISAQTILNTDPLILNDLITASQVLLGRKVSTIEGCISLSHAKTYMIAKSFGEDSYLICEDDAEIQSLMQFEKALKSLVISSSPEIYTFYSPNWAVWKKKNSIYEAKFPPPYASFYLINNSALNLAVEKMHHHVGLADWPIWSKKISFKLVENSGIINIEAKSFADYDRGISKLFKTKFRSIFNFKYLIKVPVSDRIRHIIYYPVIWKIYNLKLKQVKNTSSILLG
jgi:hypothetical protein